MIDFDFSAFFSSRSDDPDDDRPFGFSSLSGRVKADTSDEALVAASRRAVEVFAPDQRARECLAGRSFFVELSSYDGDVCRVRTERCLFP